MTNDLPWGLFIPILIYRHLTWLISQSLQLLEMVSNRFLKENSHPIGFS